MLGLPMTDKLNTIQTKLQVFLQQVLWVQESPKSAVFYACFTVDY